MQNYGKSVAFFINSLLKLSPTIIKNDSNVKKNGISSIFIASYGYYKVLSYNICNT